MRVKLARVAARASRSAAFAIAPSGSRIGVERPLLSRVLFTDAHVTVVFDEARGLVRYTRSREPFASVADTSASHEKMGSALPPFLPTGLKLLIDVRDAPPRNDAAFETVVTRLLEAFIKRFSAHAFLVRSAVGRLQTQRLARQRGNEHPLVFDDEEDALRHLGVIS